MQLYTQLNIYENVKNLKIKKYNSNYLYNYYVYNILGYVVFVYRSTLDL